MAPFHPTGKKWKGLRAKCPRSGFSIDLSYGEWLTTGCHSERNERSIAK
jgi:hypothetical protein